MTARWKGRVRSALTIFVFALLSACVDVEPDRSTPSTTTTTTTTTTVTTTEGPPPAAAPSTAPPPPDTTRPEPRDAAVEGRVVDGAGDPVAGASVVVRRSPGIAERLTGVAAALFTAGIACVADIEICDAESGVTARTVAAADGSFRLPLGPEYVPGSESDTDFYVTASEPPREGELTGPATTEEFEVAQEVQTSPELLLWRPDLDVRVTPELAEVTWVPLDVERYDDRDVSHILRFQTPDGGVIATLDRSGDRLDARILEDATGLVALTGRGDITVGPTIYHQTYEAPRLAFTGDAGPPLSRSRPCALRRADASSAPIEGCPLTDGDLLAPVLASVACYTPTDDDPRTLELDRLTGRAALPPCPPALTDATVDLGAPTDVGLIVVRGCDGCTLATSLDGGAYTPFAGRGLARQAPRSVTARYVQLRAEDGRGLEQVAELSVWPASVENATVAADGTQTPAPDSTSSSGGDADRTLPAVIATALAIAAAVSLRESRRRQAERAKR